MQKVPVTLILPSQTCRSRWSVTAVVGLFK